jgi:hypothetical protein
MEARTGHANEERDNLEIHSTEIQPDTGMFLIVLTSVKERLYNINYGNP